VEHFNSTMFRPSESRVVRKTPPSLKALAESRARVAGEVRRGEQVVERAVGQLETARASLAKIDDEIRMAERRLNPDDIEPNSGRRLYRRGELKAAVTEVLKSRAPNAVTTSELAQELEERFHIEFLTYRDRIIWRKNSIGGRLRKLCSKGLVERLHDTANAEVGRWRWKSGAVPSSDRLREQLEAEGGAFQQYDVSLE
jgi:hypothetical protein